MPTISLQEVTERNWREALSLSIHPSQQCFVADFSPVALVGLAKAYIRPLGWLWIPYAIYADEIMVGFVEMAWDSNSRKIWMFHLFIDQHHQRSGYGKQAVRSFINLGRETFPTGHNINLTVHPENVVARRLYIGMGFKLTGEDLFGEPVYCLTIG